VQAGGVQILRWLFPLAFFQAYLTGTVVLFFVGPWPWPVDQPERLLLFLLGSQLCILVGYLGAALAPQPQNVVLDERKARIFFDVCLAASLLLSIPTSLARTGSAVPDVLYGLTNPGDAYLRNYFRTLEGNASVWAEYLRIFLALPLTSTFPLLVYLWGGLGSVRRTLGIGAVAFHMAIYMATGTNKGIADVLVTLPFLLLAANWSGGIRFRLFRPRHVVSFAAALALFLAFFSAGQIERAGRVGEDGSLPIGKTDLQTDRRTSEYAQLLSPGLMVTYESLARYLGQGYFAFSMSMDLDTPSTLGVGNSMFLTKNFDQLLDTHYFSENAVPYVLEQRTGWSMMMLWHSLYTWLVSDVGITGTLFLMMVFGFLLSLSWKRALDRQGLVWVTVFYMMAIMFYYIPANNQLFQSGETTLAFATAMLWLALSGERFFYRRRN
jgi:hypothetical protein